MKSLILATAGLIVFLGLETLDADAPKLEEGVYIYDGINPLEEGPYSVPAVVDWNNDGRKDLVVGQFEEGHVYLFLNQGTDLFPIFSGGSQITSNGVPITTTFM